MATYSAARLAKRAAADFLSDVDDVIGFGIAIIGDRDFGVKLNLRAPVDLTLPPTICGNVPLVVEVVGTIRAT